ncbi:unnamed protein product [Schistosoma margrebowiei]|uniref:Uncharacterized protein n=1 Tax=Schistosoma margrebowiei TaxID=48269 RepID=A0A183M4L2_9TREM|nr:unnamed protein product [Schistosoma margrebowiei]
MTDFGFNRIVIGNKPTSSKYLAASKPTSKMHIRPD